MNYIHKEEIMSSQITEYILDKSLITICRKIYGEELLELSKALYNGGIRLIEVTFDQSDPNCNIKTSEAIRSLSEHFGESLLVGAGTVLTTEQVELAYNAGAKYIISPNIDEDVIKLTKRLKMSSIPGAMTPTEIAYAYKLGADIIKIFPAGYLGLKYIKDVRGPLSHIKLLAAGGINEQTISSFIEAGYKGFGISGRLTDKSIIENGNFIEFTKRAKDFVEAIESSRRV